MCLWFNVLHKILNFVCVYTRSCMQLCVHTQTCKHAQHTRDALHKYTHHEYMLSSCNTFILYRKSQWNSLIITGTAVYSDTYFIMSYMHLSSCIHGHKYQAIWESQHEEDLDYSKEINNTNNPYAVSSLTWPYLNWCSGYLITCRLRAHAIYLYGHLG